MTSTQASSRTDIHDRVKQLCDKFQDFGIAPDAWLNIEAFMEIMNKARDWRKLDKKIVLRILNNTERAPNGTFQLEGFFKTYCDMLERLEAQKETSQAYLQNLKNNKIDAYNALEQAKTEESSSHHDALNNFLQIEVFEAKDLELLGDEQLYVRINFENTMVNTQPVSYRNTAKWNEKFKFPVKTGLEKVNIVVLTKSSTIPRILGNVSVNISELKDQQLQEKWFSLNSAKNSKACSRIRFGFQWIYSKSLYLQSTIEKLDEHINIQYEDIQEIEKEIHEMDNLIPLLIEPIDALKNHSARSLNSDHLLPKKLDFEALEADLKRGSRVATQPGSPTLLFKPSTVGISLTSAKKTKDNSLLGNSGMKMTLPNFDQQPSQDQIRSIASSPRIFGDSVNESKVSRSQGQGYLSALFNKVPKSSRVPTEESEMLTSDIKQELDKSNKENMKLKKMLEEMKRQNDGLKQEHEKNLTKISSYESRAHMLVDEVERLSRTVAEKNKEMEALKSQNEKLNKEKVAINELENKVKEIIGENMRLNQLLIRKAKEATMWKEQSQQCQKQASNEEPSQRKQEIYSVGPKFLTMLEKSKSKEIENLNNYGLLNSPGKEQMPLQMLSNFENTRAAPSQSLYSNQPKFSYRGNQLA